MHITTLAEAIFFSIILLLFIVSAVHETLKRWWFLIESKKYMGYGTTTPKRKFWIRFPIAAIRFYFYESRDRIRTIKSRAQARF